MNTTTETRPRPAKSAAWWREPIMWLVVGGPLAVVVAGITTAVIAVRGADPVLDKEAFEQELRAATVNLEGRAKDEALLRLQPAGQARNHAASPVLPKAP